MRRWICTNRTVSGDPDVLDVRLREDVRRLLEMATDPPPGASGRPQVEVDGAQLLTLTAHLAGVSADAVVRVRTGVASRRGHRTVIPLSWEPIHGRVALPSFEGTLELNPLDRAYAELTLVGSYSVPLGPVGAAIDAVAMRGVAERTAEDLVDGIGAALASLARQHAEVPTRPPRGAGAPLTVADVMTDDPLVLLDDLPVRTAALLLFHLGVSGAPVVRDDGDLVGVLSERDLLEKEALPADSFGRRAAAATRRRDALTTGEACTKPAVTTVPGASLRDAARTMVTLGISRLVVIDGSRVAGIITRHDVLQALLRTDAELQEAVDHILRTGGHRLVRARVTWGVVDVEGEVELRSQVDRLLREIRAVDGVVGVEGAPGWRVDDVLPATVGGPIL
jgi:CBS domain-containing protein